MMTDSFNTRVLHNLERLKLLQELALTGNKFEPVYDLMTQFTSRIIGSPVALMSLVTANYQFFKSYVGLPEPWKSRRQTPLSHSFCQHVVINNQSLVVTDAREHRILKTNMAIPDLNVIAYLGVPLTMSNGNSLGSFCVIDSKPREWTEIEIALMTELSAILIVEFETRIKLRIKQATYDDLDKLRQSITTMIENTDLTQNQSDILEHIKEQRIKYNLL